MNKTIDFGSHANVEKPIIFKVAKKNETPATEGRFYPGVQGVPSEDVIFDPIKNKTIPIRYSANEESIYKSEQPAHIELTTILFTNGSFRVYKDNPTLLEYLRVCNYNKGNPNRVKGKTAIFFEYDPVAQAKELMENESLEIDARHMAKHMDFEELSAIALGVGMNVNRSVSEIRHDMMNFAKTRPRHFMEALDDPSVKRRTEVLQAIELGILRKEQRAMFLKEPLGDSQICVIPVGQDPLDYFVNWTLEDKEGEDAFKKVEKKRKKLLG